ACNHPGTCRRDALGGGTRLPRSDPRLASRTPVARPAPPPAARLQPPLARLGPRVLWGGRRFLPRSPAAHPARGPVRLPRGLGRLPAVAAERALPRASPHHAGAR